MNAVWVTQIHMYQRPLLTFWHKWQWHKLILTFGNGLHKREQVCNPSESCTFRELSYRKISLESARTIARSLEHCSFVFQTCQEKQKANLCPHCGRQFNTASAVSNHVIYVHNMYVCKKCDVTIRGYSKYRRHHLSVHTDPWHCDQCTAVFSEEAKLKVKYSNHFFTMTNKNRNQFQHKTF